MVGAQRPIDGNADLEGIVSTCLAGVYIIVDAAVCSSIEMTARTGLRVIAARLHVPEQRFAQLDCGCFIRQDALHAKNWRNWDTGKGCERPQRNHHSLFG